MIKVMNMLTKRKKKEAKKKEKIITAKTKYLGLKTRYAPSILSLQQEKKRVIFVNFF